MSVQHCFECPYCKHAMEFREYRKSLGCPLMVCSKCGKTSIDPNCYEQAFSTYQPMSLPRLFLSLVPFPVFSALIVGLIAFLITGHDPDFLIAAAISLPILWLIAFLCGLLRRKKLEQNQLTKWQASDQRLKNHEYAAALANFGFHVPARYLPSDFKRDQNAVPYKAVRVYKI